MRPIRPALQHPSVCLSDARGRDREVRTDHPGVALLTQHAHSPFSISVFRYICLVHSKGVTGVTGGDGRHTHSLKLNLSAAYSQKMNYPWILGEPHLQSHRVS